MTQPALPPDETCPECGAPHVDGLTCWEQLAWLIGWEGADPELQAEHFLTVASYNLQHPAQFTAEAIAGLWANYVEHLDHGLPAAQIRRRVSALAEGKTRVLRPPAERRPHLRHWSMTIADVYTPGRSEGAAQRVRDWAAVIRREYFSR